MSDEQAFGANALLHRADTLASRLGEYQAALGHLLRGSPEEMRNKLRILFYLLNQTTVPRDDLLGTGSAPENELRELYALGLIEARRGGFRITTRGTSILSVLLFFDADVRDVFGSDFEHLLDAVLAGQLDADTMARISSSAAARLAEDLEDETASGDLNILDTAVSTRKRSIDQMATLLGKLRGRTKTPVEREMTASAAMLTKAYWNQEHAHTVLWNQDVRYEHGHQHSDITKRLGGHNEASLLGLLDASKCPPRRFPRVITRPTLNDVAALMLRPLQPAPPNLDDLVILTPQSAPETLAPHFEALLSDLRRAKDGDSLHELAGNATTYFAGIALAILQYHPLRVQIGDVTFKVHDDRIQNQGPFVDVPRITIQRR